MKYTAVIRTLGTAGAKYQQLLNSLGNQTMKPNEIIVYIAEGYPLPMETIGIEKYIYVKKGMVAQRALHYDEVTTDYILFLDDDVFLPHTAVELLYKELNEYNGDVISPCVFFNHKFSWKSKIIKSLTGKEVLRFVGNNWAYKVLRTGGFSYNNKPTKSVYESTTNAGPCFFCKKEDFLKIHFEQDLWLDEAPYALPEDQVMYYKMHLCGLKILTSFDSGIVHLDAGSTMQSSNDKILKVIYSEYRNKIIFWYKYIYGHETNMLLKFWCKVCLGYMLMVQHILSILKLLKGKRAEVEAFRKGVKDGRIYIKQ
ncbi:MAG: glycosyl transferase family 2 [Bacteroidaceae bacterium]|nr:glycosyl transferase family 2 [Bacteroidaceae bacterium]